MNWEKSLMSHSEIERKKVYALCIYWETITHMICVYESLEDAQEAARKFQIKQTGATGNIYRIVEVDFKSKSNKLSMPSEGVVGGQDV